MMNSTSSSPVSEASQSGPSKASKKMRTELLSGGNNTPYCNKVGLKRGQWTPEEDRLLADCIKREGEGRWRTLPKHAGLLRCGKSCRLRWMNYLRPSVKRGQITPDEEDLILRLHRLLGNRWSLIAGRIPGRTDNEIKNYWNSHLRKKLISLGIDPRTHKPLNLDSSANATKASTSESDRTQKTNFCPIKSCPEENHSGLLSVNNENYGNASLLEQYQDGIHADHGYITLQNSDASRMILKGNGYAENVSCSSTDDDTFSSFLKSLLNHDESISQSMQLQELLGLHQGVTL